MQRTCESRREMPECGHIPPERERLAVREYREIHCKPYRTIHLIAGNRIFVPYVLDGRRELRELLERRLLR
ncbi:MAG: type II toxin-antitoxin system RelE/ParE family toxin [Chitinivibrionales bacterium]|nr:type II toxin-antitoxin system RelE/ParE family toxin [Chitinivibrionales bacterium]